MNNREHQLSFKNRLKQFCEQTIAERITATRKAMDNAQDAANGEEKSSVGDKYETSRAMSHLEKDMHARQLVNHLRELSALRAVNVETIYTTPVTGSIVECEQVSFFIAAGLGKQLIDGAPIIFLSPESPLAKKMLGKKIGDSIVFNGEIKIVDIY